MVTLHNSNRQPCLFYS